MGNVCAAQECQSNTSFSPPRRTEPSNKKIGGCLIIKIKKTNVNMKILTNVLMEKTGQSSLSDLVIILKFRDQIYELDTLKDNFESILKGATASKVKTSNAGKE